jgi:hypothetical protein
MVDCIGILCNLVVTRNSNLKNDGVEVIGVILGGKAGSVNLVGARHGHCGFLGESEL